MDNPFFHRGPIDDAAMVYGRRAEVERAVQLVEASATAAWVELTGPHRVGKSTVLLAVERALRARHPQAHIGRFSAQATVDTPDFWRRARIALGGPRDAEPTKQAFEEHLDAVDAAGKRAILLIDELPVLVDEGRDHAVFDHLRALGETNPLALVTAAPKRMHTFVRRREKVSAAWANAHEVRVEPFAEPLAMAFLKERARVQPFADAEMAELFAVAGGNPWRLTVAAWHRWRARAAGHDDWRLAYDRERENEPREGVGVVTPTGGAYDPGGSDEIRVFVSSPMAKLEAERAAVERACEAMGLAAVLAERFGARDGTSRQVCLGELARCHVLILLMPGRYGPTTDAGVSATQEEVEEAGRLGVPRLVYVGASGEQRDPRQDAWVRALTGSFAEGAFRETWQHTAELEERVRKDLSRLLRRRARWALEYDRQ